MNSFITIAAFVAILFACIAVITVIQKREQQKAAKKQKIAKLRYRSEQAISILTNISQLPIGKETRQILLQYALANLNVIKEITPNDNHNLNSIENLKTLLNNINSSPDNQNLAIPDDLELLRKQIVALTNLAKYILRLHKLNNTNADLVAPAINRITGLISESKISAFIRQGKKELNKQEFILAQQNFTMAENMLNRISNKDERLVKIELELQETVQESLELQSQPDVSVASEHPSNLESSTATLNEEKSNINNDPFGPRKKW